MKKGRLSKKEKQYISDHNTDNIEDIAKKLDRSTKAIEKFIQSLPPSSPQELLDRGIETGDMELVKKARAMMQESKPENNYVFNPKSKDGTLKRPESLGGGTYAPAEQIVVKESDWKDERNSDYNQGDSGLYINKPVERVRSSNMVDSRCRGCSKIENINTQFTRYENGVTTHMCNGCIMSRGGR